MICPISQGNVNVARNMGTIVTLMGTGIDTQGSVDGLESTPSQV
jgi:mRNA interferase ChpB